MGLPGARGFPALACVAAVAGGAALYALSTRARRKRRRGVAGTRRCRKHRLTIECAGGDLALDVSVAPAVGRHAGDALVVYVLDPEPVLFGAAALFVFGQAGYFDGCCAPEDPEARFARVHVVGVGHAAEAFRLTERGFDRLRLRDHRRRDFPPFEHPTVAPGRSPNARAAAFADALVDVVAPFAERDLLGLSPGAPVRRCVLGASYSAVLALQAVLRRPRHFEDAVLGSPSVCFDPEILDDVRAANLAGTRCLVVLGGDEAAAGVGNVHSGMARYATELCAALRAAGAPNAPRVELVPGEDHTSVKLALVSKGLAWFARNAARAEALADPGGGDDSPTVAWSPTLRKLAAPADGDSEEESDNYAFWPRYSTERRAAAMAHSGS